MYRALTWLPIQPRFDLADRDRLGALVAAPTVRAERRLKERPDMGSTEALATDLRLRDERDAAQMRAAADAHQIDTTGLDVEEVVARIEQLVRARSAVS